MQAPHPILRSGNGELSEIVPIKNKKDPYRVFADVKYISQKIVKYHKTKY